MKRFRIFLLNGLLLTVTCFVLRFLGFVFHIYISQKIGAQTLGTFSVIVSVYLFFITLSTSGIPLSVTRIVVEKTTFCKHADTRFAMKHCFFYSGTFGMISCMLLILLAKPITRAFLHDQIPYSFFYWIAFSLPFIAISSCFTGYFTALRKNGKNATCRIGEQIIKMFTTAYLLSCFMPSGISYACLALILGEMISEIASCFLAFFLYRIECKKYFIATKDKGNYMKTIFSISMPVALTSYIRSGLSSLKQVLIPMCLEKYGLSCQRAMSIYGNISGMVMPILLFPEVFIQSFSSLVVPEYAYFQTKKDMDKITYITSRIFRITFFFSIPILGIFLCYAKDISYAIYQTFEISSFLCVLAPLVFFMYLDGIIDNILKGLNEQMSVMKCNVIDLIVSIGFIYVLLPSFGIHGYIMVLYISEILNWSISFYQLKHLTHIMIDYKNWLFKPALGVVISYLITTFFLPSASFRIASLAMRIALFLVSYFLWLLLSRAFES